MRTYKYYSLLSEADYAHLLSQDLTTKNSVSITIRAEKGEIISESSVEWNNENITITHYKDNGGLLPKYESIFNIPSNITIEQFCAIVRQHGFMNYNAKIICPICKQELRVAYFRDDFKYSICKSCRHSINYCNIKYKTSCFKCINEDVTLKVNLDDIGNPTKYQKKIRKSYGCYEGSRLAKHCKKYKIEESDMVKYLRWGRRR